MGHGLKKIKKAFFPGWKVAFPAAALSAAALFLVFTRGLEGRLAPPPSGFFGNIRGKKGEIHQIVENNGAFSQFIVE